MANLRAAVAPKPPAPSRAAAGLRAEDIAARHLAQRGLTVVERNWRRRCGEIDLIARDGATLVFVEVRLRRNPGYGGAAASITESKRARLTATANLYLTRFSRAPACRFDAVLLDGLDPPRIEWLRNIFGD